MKSVDDLILYGNESPTLDFKRTQYPVEKTSSRNDFIKDVSAMLNHPDQNEKYIVIGVVEKGGVANSFINVENPIDQAKYQQILTKYLEPEVHFDYKSVKHQNYDLMMFRFYNNNLRPYLTKADIPNSDGSKLDSRVGDGYIRAGSSTRKMNRKDFELIYHNRLATNDRASDVEVELVSGVPQNNELSDTNVRYVDLIVKNNSNKSISIDISVFIKKDVNFLLMSEFDLLTSLDEEKAKRRRTITPISSLFRHQDHFFSIEEVSDGYKASYDRSINILQSDECANVLGENMVMLISKHSKLEATVIIRSDEFINGPVIKHLLLEVEPPNNEK